MSSSLTEVRAGFATTLGGIGLQVYANIVDVANSPACVVDLAQNPSANYAGAFHQGSDEWFFDLFIFVANNDTQNALAILDGYVTGKGAGSVRQLLFDNDDLGLSDVDCMAMNLRSYGITTKMNGIGFIGAIMRVKVNIA